MTIGQDAGEFCMAVNADGTIAWQKGPVGATVVHSAPGVYNITMTNPRAFDENQYAWWVLGNTIPAMIVAVGFLSTNDFIHFEMRTFDVVTSDFIDLAFYFRISER
jgi:hypothetical protein